MADYTEFVDAYRKSGLPSSIDSHQYAALVNVDRKFVEPTSRLRKGIEDETPLSFLMINDNKELIKSALTNTKVINITHLAVCIDRPKKFAKEIIFLLVNKGVLKKEYTYYKIVDLSKF